MTTTGALSVSRPSPWRSIGLWMTALLALAQAINAVRAFADPAGFAAYLGLPLLEHRDVGMVYIYGLRTAFIAILAATLILRGDTEVLRIVMLAAAIMPIGDAVLTYTAGAAPATVLRHAGYAVFVLLTAYMLHRRINQTPETLPKTR